MFYLCNSIQVPFIRLELVFYPRVCRFFFCLMPWYYLIATVKLNVSDPIGNFGWLVLFGCTFFRFCFCCPVLSFRFDWSYCDPPIILFRS